LLSTGYLTLPSDRFVAFRILDANLNRVLEGLRTLEDIARFSNQLEVQKQYKSLRHEIVACTAGWDQELLLSSRNADGDVGRTSKTLSESQRTRGLSDVGKAAAQRVQQALRSMEEVAKYVYPASARMIEAVRYRTYDLNSQLLLSQSRDLGFMEQARLYVLVDCQLPLEQFRSRVRDISVAGVSLIQIRDKHRDAQDLIRYTHAAIESVDCDQTRVIINDRVDIAQCTDAWGVHLGQTDLGFAQARSILPRARVLGLSTHDVLQVNEAVEFGADYIGCGPTFPSKTKAFSEFSGLQFLRDAAEGLQKLESKIPAFAIGGIDASNVQKVIDAGFQRVAVSQAVWGSPSPAKVVEAICSLLYSSTNSKHTDFAAE
jgi:thiamine-phosphate pyrophosphorylase